MVPQWIIDLLIRNIGSSAGSALAANKSLIDALGVDGAAMLSHDFGEDGLMQYAHGKHTTTYILFVIPEAVGSLTADNTAIQALLQTAGRVVTITQADALTYPEFSSVTLCVLGSDKGAASWTTSNLAHVKVIPNLPVMCCDARSATYMKIGTDNGDAETKTTITTVANIKGSILGTGIHDITGFTADAANTIADAGTTFSTLDMSNANITETWYAYETDGLGDNTNVALGSVRRIQNDNTLGVDLDNADIEADTWFYGPAYSFGDLNEFGQGVLGILILIMIHGRTIGQAITISGDIGDVATKLYGNMKNLFNNANPIVEFLCGKDSLGSRPAAGESITDMIYGANGIKTYPAAAVPANGVGLASVLRKNYNNIIALGTGAIRSTQTLELGRLEFSINATAFDQTIVNAAPANVIQTTDDNIDQVLMHVNLSLNNQYDGANSLVVATNENYLKLSNAGGVDMNVYQYTNGDFAMLSVSEGKTIHHVFDVTGIVSDIDGNYTLKLTQGDAVQNSIRIYAEVWLEVNFHQ